MIGSESSLSHTGSPIDKDLFFAFAFGGVAVAFPFVVFRLFVQWKLFRRLFWDDGLIIFSWLLFIPLPVTFWVKRDGLYIIFYLLRFMRPWTSHNIDLAIQQLQLIEAALLLFITSLWSLKLSFLVFFRRLGATKSPRQRVWWLMVTIVTVASYFALLGATPFKCASSDLNYLLAKCNTPKAYASRRILFYCHLGADIFTNVLVISIPTIMLWKVRMPLKQKLGLLTLFSLTVFVIICAVIRVVMNRSNNGIVPDATWIMFWASIELTVFIVIACCSSFRQIFKRSASRTTNGRGTSSSVSSIRKDPSPNWLHRLKGSRLDHSPGYRVISRQAGHDVEETKMDKIKHIVISHEVEVEHLSVPLKVMDRAHLAR